ncbi:DUF1819 family protein [Lysinibacillus sp. Ag94]|uniref:DUF1819 family protein n=1 Tax=Lysinibacillus sp. Ag94 TaxID=2936682 RepID=UPI0020103FBF|nr:DUF1819 family protein [Lysinibacillus sp. Ag94]UPW82657.1 DUF1819 family protein [Lysinibacillus sp. Ag94]
MTIESEYSSVLTGAGFMLYEVKQLAKLKGQGYSDQEIRYKVLEENIFQYDKLSSVKRALPYILKRVDLLDDSLRQLLIEESYEVGKVINLYAIMKFDRLFFEFMQEVIQEKLINNNYYLDKVDINAFFEEKMEQSEFMSSWSESTVAKLKQVFKKILLQVGILKDLKSGELSRLLIDDRISDHIQQMGDKNYLRAMGE